MAELLKLPPESIADQVAKNFEDFFTVKLN
jgi:hypothetical protein